MPQLMTKEEAETKVCPHMSRPVVFQGGPGGAQEVVPGYIMCQASLCACWKWADPEAGQLKPTGKTSTVDQGQKPEDAPEGHVWVAHSGSAGRIGRKTWSLVKLAGPRRGFCGAASDEAAS